VPQTVVGLFLLAAYRREDEERRRLSARLNGGRRGWNLDEPAVVQAVCELAVRRYFGADYDVRQVTSEVTFVREALLARGRTPHGQLEMEAVVRSALGEADVDVSGISPSVAYWIHMEFAALVGARMDISDQTYGELVAEAEQVAFDRGFSPPLAE
jgi:hypothetical protein